MDHCLVGFFFAVEWTGEERAERERGYPTTFSTSVRVYFLFYFIKQSKNINRDGLRRVVANVRDVQVWYHMYLKPKEKTIVFQIAFLLTYTSFCFVDKLTSF